MMVEYLQSIMAWKQKEQFLDIVCKTLKIFQFFQKEYLSYF